MAANEFVRTPDDLELVASEFALAQATQNVAYSEAGFTAGILVRNGMDPRAMWAALRRGLAAGGRETRVALIVDAIRDLGTDDASATIRLVEEADAPIVGLSLTGEAGRSPSRRSLSCVTPLPDLAWDSRFTPGNISPLRASSTRSTSSTQIGSAMASLRSKTPRSSSDWSVSRCRLTSVRGSNVAIGIFPSLEAHPFTAFWRAGVNMTISSDDPPFMNTTLTDELGHVARIAGLTRDDLAELQRRGARNSFAAPDVKAEIIAKINSWVAEGDTSPRQ